MKTILYGGLVCSMLFCTAFATEFFVATNGNDTADGRSWATAVRTLAKGRWWAWNAGDVLWVSNGTYTVSEEITVYDLKVLSVGGAAETIVVGTYPATTNRLFNMMHANAVLDGFTITNGYVADNNNYGGGVLSSGGTIRNCVFRGNRGGYGGGGLSCAGTLVTNCVFRDNRTQDGWGYGGGGVYIRKGSLMVDCTVVSNRAGASGAGVYFSYWDVPARVRNCLIAHNTSRTAGGGVAFSGNNAGMIDNCVISNNTSSESEGGGVYCNVSGCIVSNCLIVCNTANTEGGGISINGDSLAVDCLIADNQGGIANNGGGGVKINTRGTVRNCIVTRNRGFNYGGGAYMVGGGVFDHCVISNNTTKGSGGGISVYLGKETVTNCLIVGNVAGDNAGISLGITSTVVNCTLYGNVATNSNSGNGGLSVGSGSTVINAIMYGNTAHGAAKDWVAGGAFSNCCTSVTNGMTGGGNLAANPLLRDPAEGDYRLTGPSPCINAGLTEAWMGTATDLAGRSRIDRFSGKVDIGAYEFVSFGTMIRMQ